MSDLTAVKIAEAFPVDPLLTDDIPRDFRRVGHSVGRTQRARPPVVGDAASCSDLVLCWAAKQRAPGRLPPSSRR